MQTLNDFITERLKLNKDSKLEKPYKLLFIPYGTNYDLLNNMYDKYRNTGNIISVLFLYIIQAYIMDKDFFESKILKHYTDYSSYNDDHNESLDTILKIPIDLDKKDLIDKYKNKKYDNDEDLVNLIRKDFEIYKINK